MLNSTHKKSSKQRKIKRKMKNRYKLMNNYLYGKAMENLKDKSDLKLLSNEKDDLKWTSKPRYISQKIFDNDLVQFVKTNT